MDFMNELAQPLTKNDVELRVGMNTDKGFSLLLYKTARTDVRRLNSVCGSRWSNSFYYDDNKLLCCSIKVYDENINQWVERIDVGTESMTEKEKGLYSDSFKRAGFKWGIGLELYNAPFIFINWEMKNKKPIKFFSSNLEITDYKVVDGEPKLTIAYNGKALFSNIDNSHKQHKDPELQNKKKNLIATFNGKLKDVDDMAGLKKLFGEFVEKAKPLGETTVNAIVSAKDKKKAELDALHVQKMDEVNGNNEG